MVRQMGVHYLKHFVRSHELQICSNFKDGSLQLYTNPLFKAIQSEVEEIFKVLPRTRVLFVGYKVQW